MSQQQQQLEAGAIPDKQALASVLNYLKDRQLKETEQVLKRELGLQGASQMDTSSSSFPQLPPVPQSDTEPAKYQESYSRLAPPSSPSTEADLQPATTQQQQPSSHHHQDNNTLMREPLQSTEDNEDEEEDEEERDDAEQEAEGDISDPTSPLPPPEKRRPVSWPGSLPQHHLPKFPRPRHHVLVNRAPFRAATTTAPAVTASSPMAVGASSSQSHSVSPAVPLWAVGSSAFKPMTTPSLTLSSTAAASTAPISSPSVIYSMLTSQGLRCSPQPLLTPLLTILPSAALVSTTATSAAAAIGANKATPPPLILGPHGKPTSLPLLNRPVAVPVTTTTTFGRPTKHSSSAGTPEDAPMAEPATGQTVMTPESELSVRPLGQVPAQRTLASIPPSEMTPHYTELKAFAEEFKTKRIRLGYTQGSVGQSLARRGYSNFAQSTISRFEQMQLSATNAAAIKQVLEKWLQETEFPESVSSSSSDIPVMASRKRKKRAVFTPQTKSTLDEFFRQNPRPNRQAIESIARQLDLLPEEVRVWFCNKRQKEKQSSTSSVSSCYSAVSPSSHSPSAAGTFMALHSPSLSPKRRSPSPKTSFTIEELSKSSNNSSSTPSPVLLASPFSSISPTALSISATTGSPGVFPLIMPTTTLPNMAVTQTRA